MSISVRLLFLAALCALPQPLRADSDETPALSLRVEATRPRSSLTTDTTAAQSSLPRSELLRPGAQGSELLETLPGTHTLDTGPGSNGFATVQIRGSAGHQSQIYLDSIPLGHAGRTLNLQAIPIALLERVDVYRSTAPVALGPTPMGGALVLVPRSATATELSAGGGGGSFGSAELSAAAALPAGPTQHHTAVHLQTTAGDYGYRSDNGTPYNPHDDFDTRRANNDSRQLSALHTSQLRLDHHQVRALLYYHSDTGGMPGNGLRPALHARRSSRQVYAGTSYRHSGSALSIGARAWGGWIRDRQQDRLREFGVRPNDSDDRTSVYGAGSDAAIPLSDWLDMGVALQASHESYRPLDHLAYSQPLGTSHRTQYMASLQPELHVNSARLRIVPTIQTMYTRSRITQVGSFASLDGEARNHEAVLPLARLGMAWQAHPSIRTLINAARGVRLPGFTELFGDGSTLMPSTALKPETSLTADAGVVLVGAHASHSGELSLFGFATTQVGTIQFVPASQDTWIAQNLAGATMYGLELAVGSHHWNWLRTRADFDLMATRQHDARAYLDGKRLPLRAPLSGHGALYLSHRQSRLGLLELGPRLEYQSASYLDPANRVIVPARLLLHADAVLQTGRERLTLRLTGRNLLNAQVFDFLYYPLPGRSFYATAELRIL